MTKSAAIHWFRQDLRLADNPALLAASAHGTVLPVYILDDHNAGQHAMGGASRWWLHHSLLSLNASLDGKLSVYAGDARKIIPDLVARMGVSAIYWNRCHEPWRIRRDARIEADLNARGFFVQSCNGSLLWEPGTVTKADGTPYRVFTHFYRKGCSGAEAPRAPLQRPGKVKWHRDTMAAKEIDELDLLPRIPWHRQLEPHWTTGEFGAAARLEEFLEGGIRQYKDGRDLPAKPFVSRLSPHLRFGEISPHQVWHAIRAVSDDEHVDKFCSELGWREFSYNLLHHNPDLPRRNLQPRFDRLPWVDDDTALAAWQRGLTGVPMVDAGMRELWQTGYMHNRARMIAGSFLVKNLLLHWNHGERWFWDTLVDADLANNSASWQWIAGCGADAVPYFRVFNPVTQGQKFDNNGEYVRRYVPELAGLPDKFLHCPWEAPAHVLSQSGVEPGITYPRPIVDLGESRERALSAFAALKRDR